MPKSYPPEFRRRLTELARSGRSKAELAKEFEVSLATVYRWFNQDQIDHGLRSGVPSSENADLIAAKRRVRQLETELEIVQKASELFKAQELPPKGSTR